MFFKVTQTWLSPTRICAFCVLAFFSVGCSIILWPAGNASPTEQRVAQNTSASNVNSTPVPPLQTSAANKIPNLAFPSDPDSTTSPIGNIDFRNYTYPLPYGWQDADGKEAKLENGERKISEDKIGLDFVTKRFGDLGGSRDDEAVIVLRINTAGSALPHLGYVFSYENESLKLLWQFRTGDRADGGLKDLIIENGELIVELFGQDRYIFNDLETLKINGDEEQLCCPTHFTRNRYKWNGRGFVMQGKRLTYSIKDKNLPPVENKGDLLAEEAKRQRK